MHIVINQPLSLFGFAVPEDGVFGRFDKAALSGCHTLLCFW
jgi:hypothetical protein